MKHGSKTKSVVFIFLYSISIRAGYVQKSYSDGKKIIIN